MPAAKGKVDLKVSMPSELKAQIDTDAAKRGMDRSALITMLLLSSYEAPEPSEIPARLDQLIRDQAVLRDQVAQLVTAFQEVLEAMRQAPATPAKEVYPTPATWEQTYPELYAPRVEPPAPAPLQPAEKKGWGPWRR
jgi:hypothetical protein